MEQNKQLDRGVEKKPALLFIMGRTKNGALSVHENFSVWRCIDNINIQKMNI